MGYPQQLDSLRLAELKQEILHSKEAIDWQNAKIAHQKSSMDFCALKYEQKVNQAIFISCGKPMVTESYKEFTLRLFRAMRIADELKDSTILRERELRTKFPELATHFKLDEIFPELYAPIQKARGY